jgi:hypothetical protein
VTVLLPLLVALFANSDTVDYPFHVSYYQGGVSSRLVTQNVWMDFGPQLEYREIALVRGSVGFAGANENSNRLLFDGSSVPDLVREMFTVCVGHERRWGPLWLAAGAGWFWARYDTAITYEDPRSVYSEDETGLHVSTTTGNGLLGSFRTLDRAHWIMSDTLRRNGPYLMAEIGAGWKHFGVGIRGEYKSSPGIGFVIRLRGP